MNSAEFCRELEAYLCRKNDGHLIRIVGPVFGTVTSWAERGIPLKVALRGIDRYFERQSKTPRRRPVQIQFCEADILDAFDEWRRAIGVSASAARSLATPAELPRPGSLHAEEPEPDPGVVPAARRKTGLQTHIDRVMARLTQRRVEAGIASAFAETIDRMLGQLDTLRADAKGARNEVRERLVATLAALDREMLDAATHALDAQAMTSLRAEAARELEPFRSRMGEEAFTQAAAAATDRLIRERARLPVVRVDE